ncbi:Elongin-A2 [Plecturocebus cupreus]
MELQKGVLRLIPTLGHSSPPGVDPPGWLHCTDGMNSYWGGAAQEPKGPSSGSCASFPVGRRTAEVAPGCGSTSPDQADLLSCLQGPDRRSRPGGPLAPAIPPFPSPSPPPPSPHGGTEPAPGCGDSTPEAWGLRGPAPQNLWPTPPEAELAQAVTPQPEACLATGQPGRTGAPDFASRCLRAQLRPAARRDSDACTARCVWPLRRTPKKLGEISAQTLRLAHDRKHPGGDGNRKAVKSLRKHQGVGHFARDLAARWKKPLLVNPNTRPGPDPQDPPGGSSGPSAWGFPENERSPGVDLTALSTERTAHTAPPGLRRPQKLPVARSGTERKHPRTAPGDSGPHRAPPSERRRTSAFAPGPGAEQQAGRGQADAARGRPLLARGCQGQPQAERLGATARAQILPPEGVAWMSRAVGSPRFQQATSSRARSRGKPQGHPPPGSARDRPPSASAGTQKEGGATAAAATRRGLGADLTQEEAGSGRPDRKGTHGLSAGVKQQLSSDPETQGGSHRPLLWARHVGGLPLQVEEGEEAEELEQPTLSFEQYLAYDQVQKKEKDCEIFRHTPRGDQQRRTNRSKGTRESRASPLKLPPVKESHSERLREAVLIPPRRETVLGQGFSELWDLSEPWMQANYDLLSAFESMTSQPQTEAARSLRRSRTETGASGGRVNAKIQVYSGSRPARQPQGADLAPAVRRALRDNPGWGRVPSWVLHLVLEGCTPDQLYRREKNNHHSLERQTDYGGFAASRTSREKSRRSTSLGGSVSSGRHARAAAAVVTANIRAAHENKPQGRQAKMICFNSVARRLMLRGGKRSLQEPLTPAATSSQIPIPEKQPPSLQQGGGRRQRPPGLPEKRASPA